MEPPLKADIFIHSLAAENRVVLIGGMAIISHGLSRRTKDVDIWLDPMESADVWTSRLLYTAGLFPDSQFWSLAQRCSLSPAEIAEEITEVGVVRITGLDRDIDIFRRPNELGEESFDEVWTRSVRVLSGGIRLPDPLDLHITKANTGREHDLKDQLFLETLIKASFRERLAVCDLTEATSMFDRFLDPEVLQYARTNPNLGVRELARKYLHEFEVAGDPYSRDILADWKE